MLFFSNPFMVIVWGVVNCVPGAVLDPSDILFRQTVCLTGVFKSGNHRPVHDYSFLILLFIYNLGEFCLNPLIIQFCVKLESNLNFFLKGCQSFNLINVKKKNKKNIHTTKNTTFIYSYHHQKHSSPLSTLDWVFMWVLNFFSISKRICTMAATTFPMPNKAILF